MTRLLTCVPGSTWERWLRDIVLAPTVVESVPPDELVAALSGASYAGAFLLLCPRVLTLWQAVRRHLIVAGTPLVVLTPFAVEPLRRLALDRDLRLVGLHVVGVDDHPACLRASLDRLLQDGVLHRFTMHFGPNAAALETLVGPLWEALETVGSLEEWAALIGCHVEELRQKLHSLGVSSPRRLLTWLRLLAAWPRLQAGVAAGTVALAVGYSAPSALTRAAHHLVGLPPSDASAVDVHELLTRAASDLVA